MLQRLSSSISRSSLVSNARRSATIQRGWTNIAMNRSTISSSSSSTSSRWMIIGAATAAATVTAAIAFSTSSHELHAEAIDDASAVPTLTMTDAESLMYNPLPIGRHDEWVSNWDGLGDVPCAIDAESGRPIYVSRHLLFIRHGQYVLPTAETKHLDPVLTAKGREQALITGARLLSLGYPISAIHCSTMARAIETAELIQQSFPHVPLDKSELIREGVPCAHVPIHPTWVPSTRNKIDDPKRIQAGFEHLVKRWRSVGSGADERQIHSVQQWQREQQLAKDSSSSNESSSSSVVPSSPLSTSIPHPTSISIPSPSSSSSGTINLNPVEVTSSKKKTPIYVDRYELVVCHGNVIRYSLLRALQMPPQGWLRISIYNTGISHITIRSSGTVGITTLGDTGHLEKDMITYH